MTSESPLLGAASIVAPSHLPLTTVVVHVPNLSEYLTFLPAHVVDPHDAPGDSCVTVWGAAVEAAASVLLVFELLLLIQSVSLSDNLTCTCR